MIDTSNWIKIEIFNVSNRSLSNSQSNETTLLPLVKGDKDFTMPLYISTPPSHTMCHVSPAMSTWPSYVLLICLTSHSYPHVNYSRCLSLPPLSVLYISAPQSCVLQSNHWRQCCSFCHSSCFDLPRLGQFSVVVLISLIKPPLCFSTTPVLSPLSLISYHNACKQHLKTLYGC